MRAKDYSIWLLVVLVVVSPLYNPFFTDNEISQAPKKPTISISSAKECKKQDIALFQNYTVSSPIQINNNSAFTQYAAFGNGSKDNPFVIEQFNITSGNTDLISIANTTAYFIIRQCMLNGISDNFTGVKLTNVTNARIINNTIFDTTTGISLIESSFNQIMENEMFENSEDGIRLVLFSRNNTISRNTIYDNSRFGIYLKRLLTSYNIISNNTIFNNGYTGIQLYDSGSNNVISYNFIYNNSQVGIGLRYILAGATQVYNNTIFDQHYGIGVFNNVDSSTILDNYLHDNFVGIYLSGSVMANIDISRNIIQNSTSYGIQLGHEGDYQPTITYCLISWNSLLHNNLANSTLPQVYEQPTKTDNTFVFNFWTDWTAPDDNHDGIIDTPYRIAGSNTTDPYPLTAVTGQIKEHFQTAPRLSLRTYPAHLEIVVTWYAAVDSWAYPMSYDLYYSSDFGSSWQPLLLNLVHKRRQYTWDIESLDTGCYQLKVVATSAGGLVTQDVSEPFTLGLTHTLSAPEIIQPTVNDTLSGVVTISWNPAIDNCGAPVWYDCYSSSDGGTTWQLLVANYTETSLLWNTTTVANGNNYTLKIVARSFGGTQNATTVPVFSIHNKPPTSPNPFLNLPWFDLFLGVVLILELTLLGLVVRVIKRKQHIDT